MTLEQAVEILNREGHRGKRWTICEGCDDACVFGEHPGWGAFTLQDFEAVAIAREYERIARERPDPVLCRPLD